MSNAIAGGSLLTVRLMALDIDSATARHEHAAQAECEWHRSQKTRLCEKLAYLKSLVFISVVDDSPQRRSASFGACPRMEGRRCLSSYAWICCRWIYIYKFLLDFVDCKY